MRIELLRITGASKTKNGLELLRDFGLTVYAGEITFIAGASILEMNSIAGLLAGQEDFTRGTIALRGSVINRTGSMQFWRNQVAVLTDQDRLIDSVSITDNFFICTSARQPFFARDQKNRKLLQGLLDLFGIGIDLDLPASALHALQCYQLQLLKLYFHSGAKTIFLDKRKISLSEGEFRQLLQLMCQLKQRGMTFLVMDYTISSFWEMIDALVIIREARTILHTDVKFLTEREKHVLRHEEFQAHQNTPATTQKARVVLQLQDVTTQYLRGVNLQLCAGEIAAIYYTDYESAQELFQVLNGAGRPLSGAVLITGVCSQAEDRAQRVREGVFCVEEYQSDNYLFSNFTALENYCLPRGLQFTKIWHSQRYQRYLEQDVDRLAGREVAHLPLQELLPKEVLRIKLKSMLLARPTVLICRDPFSSVDQFLRAEVETMLTELAAQGIGLILFSRLNRIHKNGQYTQYVLNENGKLLKNIP